MRVYDREWSFLGFEYKKWHSDETPGAEGTTLVFPPLIFLIAIAVVIASLFGCGERKDAEMALARDTVQRGFMAAAPRASVASVTMAQSSYSADTSLYKIVYALSKSPRTGDSVRIRVTRDTVGGVPAYAQNAYRFTRRDSATFKVPKVFGKVAKYTAAVRVQKGTYIGQARSTSWQTNIAAPVDTTPPVVDTVRVDSSLAIKKIDLKPDTVTLRASRNTDGTPNTVNTTQQFCPLVVFTDGKIALRSQDKPLTVCAAEYAKFSLSARSVSPGQQAVADRLCVRWSATGGTIVDETCATPS